MRYDLVVGFDFDGFALDPGRLTRYVVALKGIAAEELRFESGWTRARMTALAALERRNVAGASRVFVTSGYQAEAARTRYGVEPARLRIVPEALDDEIRARATRRETAGGAAPEGETDPVDPVVLSVARQYRRKDTATLLHAFARLVRGERARRASLRIVGDGPELAASRRLAVELGIADRVVFTGALATAGQLDAEYRAADVFCLPSRQEGFGIVFLEAMAYGLPIAAARAGAVPEVAPDGVTSLLVEPGDAAALADVLERLLADRALAARLGAAGVARQAGFTWTATARSFLDGLAS